MKAYIKEEHEKAGRFNGHKYKLTIAMPVSNQIKTIRRCLDGLLPLLKAVPSELIITDTGSTDGTIEICREYTDHIEHFPWCDDMSAARNVGLRAAQGEWFMSIDDDEWFDDLSEIIDFFNSGECEKYGCASYIQRNYADLDGKAYSDFHTPRIARILGDIHFEGRIHDTLIGRVNPLKMLNSYANHYGFVYANKEEHLKKFNRNLRGLLKDNEEFPNDLRYIYQITKEYCSIGDYKTAIDWCLKGIEVEKENSDKTRYSEITLVLIKCYYYDNQYQLAMDVAEQFLKEDNKIDTYHIDIYWLQVLGYMGLQEYEKSIQAGMNYLDVYNQFQKGKMDKSQLLFGGCDSIIPQLYTETILNIARCYVKIKDYKNATLLFNKMDISCVPKTVYEIIQVGLEIADKSGQYEILKHLYEEVKKAYPELKQQEFIRETEVYIKRNVNSTDNIITAVAQIQDNDPYIQLNRLRLAEKQNDNNEITELINWFSTCFDDWNAFYSDVLYIALKYKFNMTPYFDLIDVDDLKFYITQMSSDFSDFSDVIKSYFKENSFDSSIKGLYWSICFFEHVVLSDTVMKDDQFVPLMREYVLNIAEYAHSIYQPELFSEDHLSALPRTYRFGYYMKLAFIAKENDHEAEYVKNLNIALQQYPLMKKPIEQLLEDLEMQHKQQELQINRRNDEFSELAIKVKSQIEQFLLQGQYEQAETVLAELAELLPNDEDVKRYRVQIQSAQAPKELGINIPQ